MGVLQIRDQVHPFSPQVLRIGTGLSLMKTHCLSHLLLSLLLFPIHLAQQRLVVAQYILQGNHKSVWHYQVIQKYSSPTLMIRQVLLESHNPLTPMLCRRVAQILPSPTLLHIVVIPAKMLSSFPQILMMIRFFCSPPFHWGRGECT